MRATMDGPATGQHDVKTGKKNRPPAARGRDPTTLGREGISSRLRRVAACKSRRLAQMRGRLTRRATTRPFIARPAGATRTTAAHAWSSNTTRPAARRWKETPTRCWRTTIERNSTDRGNSRRAATLFSTKTGFLIQIAGRWVQPGYSRADRAGAGPDKPVIVASGGGAWRIYAYFPVEPCVSVMGQPLPAPPTAPAPPWTN